MIPRGAFQWPVWICGSFDEEKGDVCLAPAHWQQLPTDRAASPWLYCDRHRPPGAEPIPEGAPFYVTRMELRVAATGAPGHRQQAADEAVRRMQCAIEGAGGVILGLRVVGRKASAAAATASPLRLLLADHGTGRDEARSPVWELPSAPPWMRWQKRRRTG